MRIIDLEDNELKKLIENRWQSASTLWSEIEGIYKKNKAIYSNQAPWIENIPSNFPKITTGRIFTNTEAVINSIINNPPKPNVIPNRDDDAAVNVSSNLEKYFARKYELLDVKETLRTSMRDLYFCRLMVLKPYWNPETDDFDVKRVDPQKVRFQASSNNEEDSEFSIEEIELPLLELINRYKDKEKEIMEQHGLKSIEEVMIQNTKVTYKECWMGS